MQVRIGFVSLLLHVFRSELVNNPYFKIVTSGFLVKKQVEVDL